MRLALISDQHFDVSSRWEEHVRIMKWIVEELERQQPDVICLGGDLFERRPVPAETDAAAAWIIALANIAPVVGVYGNHDVPQSLDVMNRLEARHPIVFYDRPAVHVVGGVGIACLPWPRRANVLAALGRAAGSEDVNQVAADALRHVMLGLAGELDAVPGERERVFLGHVQVRGAQLSTGQPLAPGADFELGLADLGIVRASAYLLGHIHRGNPNEWQFDGAPVIYPGSPRRTAYGETEAKHIVIVEVEDGRATTTWLETPATPMHLFEARWTSDRGLAITSKAFPHNDVVRGAETRLRYTVDSDQREAAAAAARELRDRMLADGAIAVKVEEVVQATTRARAPEIGAARTIDDKLVAFWNAKKITLEDERRARLMVMLAQLQTERAA